MVHSERSNRAKLSLGFVTELDDRVWTIRIQDGQLQVQTGEPTAPDACLRTDPKTLNAILEDPGELDTAMADGSAAVAGDRSALRRLLAGTAAPPLATL